MPTEEALRVMRSDEHVTWAKESANAAVTLVKDTQKILPLSPRKTKKVLLEIMGDFLQMRECWRVFEANW